MSAVLADSAEFFCRPISSESADSVIPSAEENSAESVVLLALLVDHREQVLMRASIVSSKV